MGFMDSYKQAFSRGIEAAEQRRKYSTYKTLAQQRDERFRELNACSDGQLLQKRKRANLSFEDNEIISSILKMRGYTMDEHGHYGRR